MQVKIWHGLKSPCACDPGQSGGIRPAALCQCPAANQPSPGCRGCSRCKKYNMLARLTLIN